MTTSKPIRILYMDDDPEAVNLAAIKLKQAGYLVNYALNGEQGLAMYDADTYDIIVLDQFMPIHDGLSVLRTLVTKGTLPPTIMVTGNGNESVAVEAMKLGASDYIVKDVEGGYLELLPAVIEQVWQQHHLLKENRQMLAALQQRNKDLALLNQAGQAFTTVLDLQELTHLLLQTATQLIGVQGGSIWLWDEKQLGGLICRMVYDHGKHRSILNLDLKPGEGLAGWVAKHGEGVIVSNAQDDPRFSSKVDNQTGFHTHSLITVPLHSREELIGVLEVVNKLNGEFDQDDLAMVQALASPAASAIDNMRMVDALRQHAIELQERNEELDAFAHTVAHDLKGPLVNMVGYADVLKDTFKILSPQEKQEYLQVIARTGRKMSNIVDELLLLAGVRQLKATPKPLNMKKIVAEVLNRLDYLIEDNQTRIVTPDTWPVALGYAPWIEEVWANYLSNAIKHGSQPCSVKLGASSQPDGTIRYWITDNGPELTRKEQERLFIPFARLSQVRIQGHGLGLSIVRRIIEKLNGQVGVESGPDKGNTFYFTLPAAPENRK